MAFEVVPRGQFRPRDGLGEGQVTLDKNGRLLARQEDLSLVQINGSAMVLIDCATLRIALRCCADDGEQDLAVTVSETHKGGHRDNGRRSLQLGRAIRKLGLEPSACVGRYQLKTKDNLLILELSGPSLTEDPGDQTSTKGKSRAAADRQASTCPLPQRSGRT